MADDIEIRIDGKPYRTVIDSDGVQRFPVNNLYEYLVDSGQVDINQLSIDCQNGHFSKYEYMKFCMGLGYSLCGFSDIFPDAEIENPLWKKEDK